MEIARLVAEFLKILVWPIAVVSITVLFRHEIRELIRKIRRADLPGGVSVDLQEQIQQAKQLSEKVEATPTSLHPKGPTIPLTEANARMIQLGLTPSSSGLDMSYYQALATQDPTLALAGLRIEIDVLARNLAKGFNVPTDSRESGLRLLRRLHDAGAINANQFQLAQQILQVCNAAIHGHVVSQEQANAVIDMSRILADQYLSWLSWGFGDDWKPVHSATRAGV